MKGKVKILHLIYSLEIGGAERDLINKLKEFDRDRYAFDICCMVKRGEFAERAEEVGARVFCLGMRHKLDLSAFLRFRKLARSDHYDLLHLHLFNAGLLGRLAVIGGKIPVVYTVQSARTHLPLWKRWIERVLSRKTGKIIGSSDAVGKALESFGVASHVMTTIYNAVDFNELEASSSPSRVRKELGIRETTFVIGTIARLRPVKGVRHLIRAAAGVRQSVPDFRVIIAGDGPERKELESLSAALGLTDTVRFLGMRRDIRDVITAMDLFVLSSDSEAFGIAVVEALGCRIPVVASRVGGIPEVVREGDTGLLFTAGHVDEMVEKIVYARTHREVIKAMARRGEEDVKHRFAAAVLAAKTEQVYLTLLGGS